MAKVIAVTVRARQLARNIREGLTALTIIHLFQSLLQIAD
jgi:hypothetical protein